MLLDLFIIAIGISACAAIYVIVARMEIDKEGTATDDMWARGIEHYRPTNQKGAGDESPDAPERCAERDVSELLEDTMWI